MYTFYIVATGLLIIVGAWVVFARTGDALHPAVVIAPFLLFGYSVWPLLINRDDRLMVLFGEPKLTYVTLVYCVGVASLYFGLTIGSGRKDIRALRSRQSLVAQLFSHRFTDATRSRLYRLGIVLGVIALIAFSDMISNVGGFYAAFSRAKGGGYATSGYIGEAILLSFPAILLIALARQGLPIRWQHLLLALVISLPHLIQGTFGGRRGPLFLVLSVLVLGWFVARGKRLRLRTILPILFVIGSAVIFIQSQRHHFYLGSEGGVELGNFLDVLVPPDERIEHNDYVAGVANVITVDYTGDVYWGHRFLVTIFIRPIPKQIWPTKYEDVGATWISQFDEDEGGQEVLAAVGFLLPRGSAVGVVSDVYREFWWGFTIFLFFMGLFLAFIWRKHRMKGGVWTVLLVEALILSVYLPTQSFSAFFHRYLIMSVVTVVVWKVWVRPRLRHTPGSLQGSSPYTAP